MKNCESKNEVMIHSYNLYQRRYPIRLPKLMESPENVKRQTLSSNNSKRQNHQGEQAESAPVEGLFFKCDDVFPHEKILKDVENLKLEDLLGADEMDEDTLEEPAIRVKMASALHPNLTSLQRDIDSYLNVKNKKQTGTFEQSIPVIGKKGKQDNDIVTISPTRKLFPKQRPESVCVETFQKRSFKFARRRASSPKAKSEPVKDSAFDFIKQFHKKTESSKIKELTKIHRVSANLETQRTLMSMHKNGSSKKNSDLVQTQTQEKQVRKSLDQHEIEHIKNEIKENLNTELIEKNDLSHGKVVAKCDEQYALKRGGNQDHIEIVEPDFLWKLLEDHNVIFDVKRDEDDKLCGKPISGNVAKGLQQLLFGSTITSFNSTWRDQTLVYAQDGHYGLKFYKDGPVEIMTALQTFVIKHLLFVGVDATQQQYNLTERLQPDKDRQFQCLLHAVCDMVWKAGDNKQAVVALPIGKCKFIADSSYREDKITEKMELFKFNKRDDLEKFFRWNLHKLQDFGSCGCISLLYSIMLSRGLSNVKDDCAELKHGLMCSDDGGTLSMSQALINLCIYGKAIPNVFNGDKEMLIDEELDLYKSQKGIKRRCEIGFLTHKEHTDSKEITVGSCLKTPYFPIWITHNIDRLCVLFSLKKDLLNDWKFERRFDLYHYQGISRYIGYPEIDIKLTVDTILPYLENEYDEEDNSTLEEVIRTKWNDAVINWNGYTRF